MTRMQRIRRILLGIALILFSIIGIRYPQDGCLVIAAGLTVALIARGLSMLLYYLTMARYMVGGKDLLFRGIIILDLGAFTLTVIDEPRVYIVLYVVGYYLFAGFVNILHCLEDRRLGSPAWRINLFQGIVDICITAACLASFRSYRLLILIFCGGLIYSGILLIIDAFRRIDVVYVQ